MNLLVCVKQVPDTDEISLDPVTNALIRAGVPAILNPCDRCALEAALCLREENGGRVTVLCMGPEQAREALRDCIAAGADEGWLACDPAFGGSDTLATSQILSAAVRALEKRAGRFDLILCGQQAADGETAQVGPELAEWLGLPQITGVACLSVAQGRITAERETAARREIWETTLPCLVTVGRGRISPRCPTLARRLAARRAEIGRLDAAALRPDPAFTGREGSPTRVIGTFVPQTGRAGLLMQGDPKELAVRLDGALREKKLL